MIDAHSTDLNTVAGKDSIATVRVPSSTSNLGAGFDCLGLALDIWLEASIVEGDGPPVYGGALTGFDPTEDFTASALGTSLPDEHHLEVISDIPLSRGLGSSAAAIVAGYSLAHLANNVDINRHSVFELAAKLEGHPDNAGPAVYGGLFLHAGVPRRLKIHPTLGIALAIPGSQISTHEARSMIPAQLPRMDAIGQASSSAALLLGLTAGDGDLISHGMIDRIAVPVRSSLIEGYDEAVQAGVEAGAYGVTISGAGSTLVAICPREGAPDIADAIAQSLTASGNPAQALSPEVVESGMEVLGQ